MVSGDGPVLGITVDDSYLTLPAEVFTNKNGSGQCRNHKETILCYEYSILISVNKTLSLSFEGFIALYYFRNLAPLFPEEQR